MKILINYQTGNTKKLIMKLFRDNWKQWEEVKGLKKSHHHGNKTSWKWNCWLKPHSSKPDQQKECCRRHSIRNRSLPNESTQFIKLLAENLNRAKKTIHKMDTIIKNSNIGIIDFLEGVKRDRIAEGTQWNYTGDLSKHWDHMGGGYGRGWGIPRAYETVT